MPISIFGVIIDFNNELRTQYEVFKKDKDIKKADTLMKNKLLKYNVKREIYKVDNLVEVINILKELQKKQLKENIPLENLKLKEQ